MHIYTYEIDDSPRTLKLLFGGVNHAVSLMLIDLNGVVDVYATGSNSGIVPIKVTSKTTAPSFDASTNTVSIPCVKWSSVIVLTKFSVTEIA